MKIAVTGASGFLGSRLLSALLAGKHRPIAIARSADGIAAGVEKRLTPDLMQADLAALLEGADVVVHCAAKVRAAASSGSKDEEEINRDLPLRLAGAARKAGVSRFVQLSSVAAIASSSRPGEVITDDTRPRPSSAYGRSKLAADIALAAESGPDLTVISLRPPTIFGPGVTAYFALLMRCAKYGVPLPIGAIENLRSVSFVGNMTAAIIAACESRIEGAYIVADSPPLSTAELYRKLLGAYGRPDRVFRCPEALIFPVSKAVLGERADSLFGNAAFDGSRFEAALGWAPHVALDEAIAQTVATAP